MESSILQLRGEGWDDGSAVEGSTEDDLRIEAMLVADIFRVW